MDLCMNFNRILKKGLPIMEPAKVVIFYIILIFARQYYVVEEINNK